MYGAIPSIGLAVAVPLQSPTHTGLVADTNGSCSGAGSTNVADVVMLQPLTSATVTVYVPAHSPVNEFVDCPVVHV